MNDVKLPIKTIKKGEKTTKVCVEDIYKMLNRIIDSMDKTYNNSIDIINSVNKTYDKYTGELIIGTGVSQPCNGDVYDEEIGNNIAFMKAKLNANLKKRNILYRIWNEYTKIFDTLNKELIKIDNYVDMDIKNIRKYNPEYLNHLTRTNMFTLPY